MGTLGNGHNVASIYTRDGRSELLSIDGVSDLSWGRTQGAFSEASVSVLARLTPDCWSSLGDVHAWAHSLVIHRDDERVWEGPLRNVSLSAGKVDLVAGDVSAWLTRRRIRLKRKTGDTEVSVLSEAQTVLSRAFGPDDPNVLTYVQTIPDSSAPTTARDVDANSGYYYDDLGSLVGAGLQWTVVGRRIVLFTDNVFLGQTEVLVPELHTTADVILAESGDDLATAVTAANEKVEGTAYATGLGSVAGVSDFYGLHDMLTENLDRKKAAGLQKVAARAARHRYPVPQVVVFPDDTALDPAAPIEVRDLVPGTLVPFATNATPRPKSGTFVLTGMGVKQDAEGETVTVSLAPVAG